MINCCLLPLSPKFVHYFASAFTIAIAFQKILIAWLLSLTQHTRIQATGSIQRIGVASPSGPNSKYFDQNQCESWSLAMGFRVIDWCELGPALTVHPFGTSWAVACLFKSRASLVLFNWTDCCCGSSGDGVNLPNDLSINNLPNLRANCSSWHKWWLMELSGNRCK